MKKKIVSVMLVALMALSLLPTTALAAGKSIYCSESSDTSGEGYLWDSASKTLTLSGLNLRGGSITLPDGAALVLEANSSNTVKSEGEFAIYAQGSLKIKGRGSLRVTAAGSGIGGYESNLSIEGAPTLTVTAAEDALVSGDWQGMMRITGEPTLKLTAGGDGIKAVGSMDAAGGTLSIKSGGNGIYVDGSLFKLADCNLTIRSKGNGITGYFRNYEDDGGADGCVIERCTLNIAAASCVYSADRTVSVTDSIMRLKPDLGAGLLSENEQVLITNGTTAITQGSMGIESETGTIISGAAQVTLDTNEALRGGLSLENGSRLTLGKNSNTVIAEDMPWEVKDTAELRNNGSVENYGGLTVDGSFANQGVYVHAAAGALRGTGAFSCGQQARVIMQTNDEEPKLKLLGEWTRARTEPLDYTAYPLPADGDGYSWDPNNRTLTLSGAVILIEEPGTAIRLPENSKLLLTPGTVNKIRQRGETSKAVRAEGDLLVYGSGALHLQSGGIAMDVGGALTACGVEMSSWSEIGIVADDIYAAGSAIGMFSTGGACLVGMKSITLDHVMGELYSPNDTVARVTGVDNEADAEKRLRVEPLPSETRVSVLSDEAAEAPYAALTAADEEGTPLDSLVLTDFETRHVVVFEPGNWSGAFYQVLKDGELAEEPEAPKLTLHLFGGWYEDALYTTRYDFATPVTGDITLRAKWIYIGGSKAYTLSFDSNGGTEITGITRAFGASIDLSGYKPVKTGFTFGGWYTDSELTERVTSVKLSQNMTVYAKWYEELPFTDVTAADWFYGDVLYVYENGLMTGTGDTTFSPNDNATRGMIVTILYRLEGEPSISDANSFGDVKPGSYYERAICWAARNSIVEGYGDGSFGPDDCITREQLAAILYRYAGFKGYGVDGAADLSGFLDCGAISGYALKAMAWANGEGLINGMTDNVLDPAGNAARGQVAAVLRRFCENTAK